MKKKNRNPHRNEDMYLEGIGMAALLDCAKVFAGAMFKKLPAVLESLEKLALKNRLIGKNAQISHLLATIAQEREENAKEVIKLQDIVSDLHTKLNDEYVNSRSLQQRLIEMEVAHEKEATYGSLIESLKIIFQKPIPEGMVLQEAKTALGIAYPIEPA